MSEELEKRRRTEGRSPPFPFVALDEAILRVEKLDRYSKGYPIKAIAAVAAWGYSTASSGGKQTIAALKAFKLLTDLGNSENRMVQVSDFAKRLLRNPPPDIRERMLQEAALAPTLIKEYWERWGVEGRPADNACLWHLTDERRLTPDAATRFLSVYDATLSYAGLAKPDSMSAREEDPGADLPRELNGSERRNNAPVPIGPAPEVEPEAEVRVMDGERELERGSLSKEASFRLIVRGEIGSAEYERLIKRFSFLKEIMLEEEKKAEAAKQRADAEPQLPLKLAAVG